jgi:hypothetical protein
MAAMTTRSAGRSIFLLRQRSGGPANHEIEFVPAIEFADGIEDRLSDLDEGRSYSHGSPISQRAFADLATVTGNNFLER